MAAVAARAPRISCPSPPILSIPPRKEMQIPTATSSRGVAFTSVSAMEFKLPKAPSNMAA